mgnify:CR=1 FL=1
MNVNEDSAELYIYGDIASHKWYEEDVCVYDMAKELSGLNGKSLKVRINSYGGEVAEGLAIYNLLKSYSGEVTTLCDGFACSAASVIFMAGKNRVMPRTSLLMIHNAWTYACGNADDLRKVADEIEKITQPSIEIYKSNSSLSEEEIKKMMDDETWITADEALSYGFATEISEESVQQSVRDDMMSRIVLKNKKLEKQLKELEQTREPVNEGWFF